MKILVTGASGFVGRAIVADLLERGHQVAAVFGPRSSVPRATEDDIEYVKADVADPNSVHALIKLGPSDAVIHAAGIAHRFGKTDDSEYQRVNVQGVRNVAGLSAQLGARRFVLISSVLVYGREGRVAGRPVAEDDDCQPVDAYAKSKLDGELAATEVCRQHGIPISILRPAPIIGEGSKGNFARLIAALHRGRFVWIGNGSNLKSLVYVGDVARVAVRVAEQSEKSFEILNVAAEPVAMRDIVNMIAVRLEKSPPKIAIPPSLILPTLRVARATPLKGIGDRLYTTLETWLSEDVYTSERLSNSYDLGPTVTINEAIEREVGYYLKCR